MTEQQHPITPPDELVRQWVSLANEYDGEEVWVYLATQAARWGDDQRLEACCEWVANWAPRWPDGTKTEDELRAAMRPSPPPSAKQALALLDDALAIADAHENAIRDLLERLASPACLVIKSSPELIESFAAAGAGQFERLQPQPVADGEASKLAFELRHFLAGYQQMRGLHPEHIYSIHRGDAMEAHLTVSRLDRIAALLERLQPQPVADGEVGELVRGLKREVQAFVAGESSLRWLRGSDLDRIAALLERLQPQPVADGEVGELVAALRSRDRWMQLTDAHVDRSADLLERLSPPQPIPVSERPPGAEDCDAEGRCWWFHPESDSQWDAWHYSRGNNTATHWLAAHALPLPLPATPDPQP